MFEYYERMLELLQANLPFVSVTVVDAQGSVPQEIGAKMLVVESGSLCGTIGGGKVETRAIAEAHRLLRERESDLTPTGTDAVLPAADSSSPTTCKKGVGSMARTFFANWGLEKDIGMTCGGSVKVYFEAYNISPWRVTVFGAGHCANALVRLLLGLDCRITCIDPRVAWLDKLPDSPKLTKIVAGDMPSQVADIPDGSFVVLITMGHTTDKPILLEILRNWGHRQFPFLGVIGSEAKAARLRREVLEIGLPASYSSAFVCPIGLELGNNEPNEIAISIVAQLLQVRGNR